MHRDERGEGSWGLSALALILGALRAGTWPPLHGPYDFVDKVNRSAELEITRPQTRQESSTCS